jgi:cell division protein FtsQ
MDDRGRFRGSLKDSWRKRLCAFAGALVLAAIGYYGIKHDRLAPVLGGLQTARDQITQVAGLGISSIVISGNQHVSREEVLAIAGITGATSLLFLDAEQARDRLRRHPWIADASILKLYPRELQIGIRERAAFALWQKDGRISVIADDGTVLEPYVAPSLVQLPLVVGSGAQHRAKDLLGLLDRYPAIRDLVWASVLVGERRWNLRLKNGIEVRLPETNVAPALDRLAAIAREKNLLTRDITIVDLRLGDRVSVRLSDRAAAARADTAAEKAKKKGGNA